MLWTACGPLTPTSGSEFRFHSNDSDIRVTESGAVIIGKRQVGSVDKDGRVTTSSKQIVAWVKPTEIRLKGGKVLRVRADKDDALYVPLTDQEAAGIKPEPRRIRKNGSVVQSQSATAGPKIIGSKSVRSRALALFILLSVRNDLWPQ